MPATIDIQPGQSALLHIEIPLAFARTDGTAATLDQADAQ
jgi:hypothetical protein